MRGRESHEKKKAFKERLPPKKEEKKEGSGVVGQNSEM